MRFSRDQRKNAKQHKIPLVRIVVDGLHLGEETGVDVSGPAPKFVADELRRLIHEWKEASEAANGRRRVH